MLTRVLRVEVLVVSALGIVGLAIAIGGRLFFPWPLEWMEGATLSHALRLLSERAIYVPPSPEFIPNLYTPLSYLPIAASLRVFGESLPAARLPSVLATALTLWFLGRAAARAGGGILGGLLAAGLWALGYGYGGGFYDLARVDAVFLLLVAAGTERIEAERPRTALLLFALSFFAKQQGILYLLAASIWLAKKDLLRNLPGLVGVWCGTVFLWIALHVDSSGWFTTYCLSLPRTHGLVWRFLPAYLLVGVFLPLPCLAAGAAVRLWRGIRTPRPVDVLLLAGLLASATAWAHPGAYFNVLLPGFAGLVVVSAPTFVRAFVAEDVRPRVRVLVAVALAVQVALLFQWPTFHWPGARTDRGFRLLVAELGRCANGGPSVALDHSGLTGTPFFHTMALSDLREGGDWWLARKGTRAVARGLAGDGAPAAIGVGETFGDLDEAIARSYRLCTAVPSPPMTTGYQPPDVTIYSRAGR